MVAKSLTSRGEKIDRDFASLEDRGAEIQMVPLVFHDVFQIDEQTSEVERLELAIKQAALRIVAGMEHRSLRTIAREIGCRHSAIGNAVERICHRLNIRIRKDCRGGKSAAAFSNAMSGVGARLLSTRENSRLLGAAST
jgi:hypothetical protein